MDHPVADDLQRASDWLDEHPELLDLVAADVDGGTRAATGRHGLTCETILRGAVLKHLWQHSYRSLEFLLRDSVSAQRFARVEAHRAPGKTALQATIGAIRAATWERIGGVLLGSARVDGVETGERVRIDSTVTETHILSSEDSRLLYDAVRVLTRLLGEARERLGPEAVAFHDHCRAAKRRALEIRSSRGAGTSRWRPDDRRGRVPLSRARLHAGGDGAVARVDRRPAGAEPPCPVEGVLPARRLVQARRRAQGHDGAGDHAGHAQGRPDHPAAAEVAAEPARAHRLRAGHRTAAVPGADNP